MDLFLRYTSIVPDQCFHVPAKNEQSIVSFSMNSSGTVFKDNSNQPNHETIVYSLVSEHFLKIPHRYLKIIKWYSLENTRSPV